MTTSTKIRAPDDLTEVVLRVTEYDKGRYLVQSQECSDTKYLVTLSAFQGRGHCECPHFRCRLEALATADPNRLLSCKHIRAVHHALTYAACRKTFADTEDKPETGG